MAKAKSTQIIPPFPSDIDRDAFGHWLSGFTDGEGSFNLQFGKPRRLTDIRPTLTCAFSIALRRDDLPILQLIQSYWQCGTILHYDCYGPRDGKPRKGNPSSLFGIHNSNHLAVIVVPHFDRYPMFAKKRRDFQIWKKAVLLKAEVSQRKYRGLPSGKGCTPKWTEQEIEYYGLLKTALQKGRLYDGETSDLPPPPPIERQPSLFDQAAPFNF